MGYVSLVRLGPEPETTEANRPGSDADENGTCTVRRRGMTRHSAMRRCPTGRRVPGRGRELLPGYRILPRPDAGTDGRHLSGSPHLDTTLPSHLLMKPRVTARR